MMLEMTDKEKADMMLSVYFRTQAAIEKYMGAQKLPEWTEYMAKLTAENTRKTAPTPEHASKSIVIGLAKVLSVYGSDYELDEQDGQLNIDVQRCGIFDYRERVREQGVELTLKSPCEFCVDLRYQTAKELGVEVSHELGHRGCKWSCKF